MSALNLLNFGSKTKYVGCSLLHYQQSHPYHATWFAPLSTDCDITPYYGFPDYDLANTSSIDMDDVGLCQLAKEKGFSEVITFKTSRGD